MSWLGTGTQRAGRLAWLCALLLLVAAPFLGVYPIFVMTALCFAIFAMAFNLLLGFTGLLSFGHAAFFGGAAYVTGWLVHDQHWSPELGLLAGVMAAPIYQVNPLMGADIIIVVFAVVVIGGMGSIMGAIVSGFGLGIVEGLTKVFYPEASSTVIFVIMAIVLLIKPAGLFGRTS